MLSLALSSVFVTVSSVFIMFNTRNKKRRNGKSNFCVAFFSRCHLLSGVVLMLICTRVAAGRVMQQVHMGDSAASVRPQTWANENVSQKNTNTVVCLPQRPVYPASGTDAHPWTRHQRGTMAACSHPVFNMPLADMFPVYSLFGKAEIMTFATCRWHLADGLNPAKKANRQDVRMCSQTKKKSLFDWTPLQFQSMFLLGVPKTTD